MHAFHSQGKSRELSLTVQKFTAPHLLRGSEIMMSIYMAKNSLKYRNVSSKLQLYLSLFSPLSLVL